jgi:hypothetical protein
VTTDEARLEDIAWMAETGVGMSAAAQRLGMTERGLDIWLARRKETALRNRLRIQNPRDHNLTTVTTGRTSNR